MEFSGNSKGYSISLGDVGFGTTEELKELVSRLNGLKVLIRGNHDFKRGVNGWKEVGFSEVYKKKIILENLILTHEPIEVEEGYTNVFGHIHVNHWMKDLIK